MTDQRYASVWDAIEDASEQSENMKLRASLMTALKERIARSGISQAQAAELFGVTQPRVSDLVRGKINLFGLDALVNMASAAGLHVELRVEGIDMATTKAQRRLAHEQALASTRIEGHQPSPEFLADCEAVIEGTMTRDQARAASLARALAKDKVASAAVAPVADAA